MGKTYEEAFAELSKIFDLMPKTLLDKIPSNFKRIIEENKSKEYSPIIEEPLEKCNLREETIIFLSLIYRDFLCSEEEKEKLQYRDSQMLKEADAELRKKYDSENIFKNNVKNKTEIKNEEDRDSMQNLSIITYEHDKWYKKIINKIKKLLKRQK